MGSTTYPSDGMRRVPREGSGALSASCSTTVPSSLRWSFSLPVATCGPPHGHMSSDERREQEETRSEPKGVKDGRRGGRGTVAPKCSGNYSQVNNKYMDILNRSIYFARGPGKQHLFRTNDQPSPLSPRHATSPSNGNCWLDRSRERLRWGVLRPFCMKDLGF